MELDGIVFDVVDMNSLDSIGKLQRSSDGSLDWTSMAATVPPDSEDVIAARWCLDAGRQHIDGFDILLDLNSYETRISAAALDRLSALLSRPSLLQDSVRAAVVRDFDTLPLLKNYLLPELFGSLEQPYLTALFPGVASAEDLFPRAFFSALTLCRVGYYDRIATERAGEVEAIVADYRFLVSELLPGDMERRDDLLLFGSGYDITNQVLAARLQLDGTLIELSIES